MFEKELTQPIGVFNVFIPSIKGYSYHYNPSVTSNPSDNANQINNISNHDQINNQTNKESVDNQINNSANIQSLPEPHDELPSCPDLESYTTDKHAFYINPKQFYRVLRRREIRKMCIKRVNKKRKINICNENKNDPPIKKRKINVNRNDNMCCDDDSDDLHIL